MNQEPSRRLQQLEKMLEREPNDPFVLYGIALEYKKANEPARAIEYLDRTLAVDPAYCYAYFQRGQVQESQGQIESARRTYRDGIEAARRKGDAHAQGELEGALQMLS
jgi:tetratricopeptide (TPR) repeat protein